MSWWTSRRSSSERNAAGGFTLVEVLVAISILAIALTSIYGIFGSVSRVRERLDADSAEYHRARVIFDRLGRELRGACFRSQNSDLVFSGGASVGGTLTLELTTTAVSPLSTAGSGIARVSYLLEPDREAEGGGLVLLRSERAVHEVEAAQGAGMMRLAPGIESMGLRFLSNGAWQPSWDGRTAGLPEMVEVALTLRAGSGRTASFLSAFELPEGLSR